MRRFFLVTATMFASMLPTILSVRTTFAQDHLDGVGDSLFLFNAGVWSMNQWNPSGSETPPPSYFGSDVVSGGFVFFADGGLNGGPAGNVPLVGDVNGDGIADIVAAGNNTTPTGVFVGRNTGTQSGVGHLSDVVSGGPGPVGNVGFPDNFTFLSASQDFFLGDVNGDGREDAIAAFDNGSGGTVWEAKTSDANGIDDGTGAGGVLSFASFGQPANEAIVGDFNADGLTDIGQIIIGGAANGFVQTILSKDNLNATGIGLNSTPTAGNVDIVQGPAEINTNHIKTLVGDLNGDGFDDIVSVDDRFSNGNLLWVARLTGADIAAPSGISIGAGGNSFANGIFSGNPNDTSQIPLLADINGDGRDDLVLYHEFTDPGDDSGGTDVLGQFLVAYTDANGDLGNSAFNDQVFYNITAAGGLAGNIPLAGQVHLPTTAAVPGDYNNNGVVDAADYSVWLDNLGAADESGINNNGDGLNGVDLADYDFWKMRFGNTSGTAASSVVPEPASWMLITLVSLIALCNRRWIS